MEKKRAYMYTRVSTAMQVEGYSLEAQEEKIRRYCEYHDMEIVRTYSDKGKSGSTIVGALLEAYERTKRHIVILHSRVSVKAIGRAGEIRLGHIPLHGLGV